MLDLRQRVLVGIGIGAGIILAVFLLWTVLKDEPVVELPAEQINEQAVSPGAEGVQPSPGQKVVVPEMPPVLGTPGDNYIRQTARTFVERFASYSNQDDNAHIEDALALASPNMVAWIESQRVTASTTYMGVTTRVVTSKITGKTDTTASVHVDTQQIKNGNTSYRAARVQLVKQGNDWKVSGLFWE